MAAPRGARANGGTGSDDVDDGDDEDDEHWSRQRHDLDDNDDDEDDDEAQRFLPSLWDGSAEGAAAPQRASITKRLRIGVLPKLEP